MPVIGVRLAYLVHSQHTVFYNLPNVLAAISYNHSSISLMMQLKIQKIEVPAASESVCLLRMTLIVLCLVKYLSPSRIKCISFQYENI
jgi:hypothetical protein